MKPGIILALWLAISVFQPLGAQVLWDNGLLYISDGAIVTCNGNVEVTTPGNLQNNGNLTINGSLMFSGTIEGDGNHALTGNWINYGTFNAGNSTVEMTGSNQNIEGAFPTIFNNLVLTGTGVKTLEHHCTVDDTLNLVNSELALNEWILSVENPDVNAVIRDSGFISTNNYGWLNRKTNSTSDYLFPLGSATGTPRFKPISISPKVATAGHYSCSFLNTSTSADGYPVTQKEATLCSVNNDFYHRAIGPDAGVTVWDNSGQVFASWSPLPVALWVQADSSVAVNQAGLGSGILTPNWNFDNEIITLAQPSIQLNAGPDISQCGNNPVVIGPLPGTYDYVWNTGDTTSQTSVSSGGNYILTASLGICQDSDTVNVVMFPLPAISAGNDTTIYNGTSILLQVVSSPGTFSWNPLLGLSSGTIQNPVANPEITTTYYVSVTDANGCVSNDTITLFVTENPDWPLTIFNTFTPNGDGYNDIWFIENIDKYPDNHLWIYNRNGHLVYEKQSYLNDWEGKYYGTPLPAATYYYILETGPVLEIFKGDVTIIR
jgi:gliding motility-associated-like protein